MYSYSKDGITVASVIDTRKPNAKGQYPAKIRVNQNRVRNYYSIGISMTKSDWEKLPNAKSTQANNIKEAIENSFSLVRDNVEALAQRGDFSFDALNCRLGRATGDNLNNAIRAKLALLLKEERIGSMELLKNTLLLVEQFAGKDIPVNAITVQWLKNCEKFWAETKNTTTIGMHMRNIRALMNDAKRAGVIRETHYPFGKGKYEIKTGEGTKKALTLHQIKQIFDYTDSLEATDRYKNLWMFIYLCNGVNVADLIKLQYSNIVDGFIYFVRQKTENTNRNRKQIKVAITPILQNIIDIWGNPDTTPDSYIFPYLKGHETAQQRKDMAKDVTKRINKRMNRIGKELEMGTITTYVARHSFATISKRKGVNIAYISESLGHSDLKTTEAYLASFDNEQYQQNASLLTDFA